MKSVFEIKYKKKETPFNVKQVILDKFSKESFYFSIQAFSISKEISIIDVNRKTIIEVLRELDDMDLNKGSKLEEALFKCCVCKLHYKKEMFNADASKRNGIQRRCIKCFKEYYKKNKENIRDKQNKRAKESYHANIEENRKIARQIYYDNREARLLKRKELYQKKKQLKKEGL